MKNRLRVLPIKASNAWVRGAPRRLTFILYSISLKNQGVIYESLIKAPQGGVEPSTSALGEPRSIL